VFLLSFILAYALVHIPFLLVCDAVPKKVVVTGKATGQRGAWLNEDAH
jgi:hypothetical protein